MEGCAGMNMVHIAHFDAARAGWNYSQAVNALGDHKSLLIIMVGTPAANTAHLWAETQEEESRAALASADAIFWHVGQWHEGPPGPKGYANTTDAVKYDITDMPWCREFFTPDRSIVWFNGSRSLRTCSPFYRQKYRDFRKVATTPDLCLLLNAHFVPCCIDSRLDSGEMGRLPPYDSNICGGHFAACDQQKNSAEIVGVFKSMNPRINWCQKAGGDFEIALEQKRHCDLVVDHFQGYYGCNTIEATALGIVAVNGLAPSVRDMLVEWCGGDLPPWPQASNGDELRAILQWYQREPGRVDADGKLHRAWYERCFGNELKAERLVSWLDGGGGGVAGVGAL